VRVSDTVSPYLIRHQLVSIRAGLSLRVWTPGEFWTLKVSESVGRSAPLHETLLRALRTKHLSASAHQDCHVHLHEHNVLFVASYLVRSYQLLIIMIFSAYPIKNNVLRRKQTLFRLVQILIICRLFISGNHIQSVGMKHCRVSKGNEVNLVLLGGVPMTDSGGGQRSSQLAIWAKQRSYNVHHFHVLSQPSGLRGHVKTNLGIPDRPLRHTTPSVFLRGLRGSIIMLVELPHKRTIPWLDAAMHLSRAKIVVEVIDDWRVPELGGGWYDPETLRQQCTSAHGITVTADALRELLPTRYRQLATLVPNAAAAWQFQPETVTQSKTAMYANHVPKVRTVLYIGAVWGSWFSWEHVVATASKCQNTLVIIIGDITDAQRLKAQGLANIVFAGPKPHEELNQYLFLADSALIPFRSIYDTISPIKLYEYIFSGKKVISTHSETIPTSAPGVFIGATPEQFADLACDESLESAAASERVSFMLNNSWGQRVQEIVQIVQEPPQADFALTVVLNMPGKSAELLDVVLRNFDAHIAAHSQCFTLIVIGPKNFESFLESCRKVYYFDLHYEETSDWATILSRKPPVYATGASKGFKCPTSRSNAHLWAFLNVDSLPDLSWIHELGELFDLKLNLGVHGMRTARVNTSIAKMHAGCLEYVEEDEEKRKDTPDIVFEQLVVRGDLYESGFSCAMQGELIVCNSTELLQELERFGYTSYFGRFAGMVDLSSVYGIRNT